MKYKTIVKDFLNDLWNVKAKEVEEIHEFFSDKTIISSPLGKKFGKKQLLNINTEWLKGFPNIGIEGIDLISEGNKVVASWTCHGRHENSFNGFEPTYNKVNYKGITIFEFEDKKIVNYECYINMLNIYEQLGMHIEIEKYKHQNILKLNYKLLIQELQNFAPTEFSLTGREVECLCLFVHGRTTKEIGQYLNISYRTAETYIANCMYKLNTHSRKDLIDKVAAHNAQYIFRDLYDLIIKKMFV